MPKYVSVIVNGGKDYRRQALRAFDERLAMMIRMCNHLNETQPDLKSVLFPAGYFSTDDQTAVKDMAVAVRDRLEESRLGFGLVWGIDSVGTDLVRDGNGYPFYVFAKLPGRSGLYEFQQTAITAAEGRESGLADRWGGRSPTIGATRDALLICGESKSERLLERVRAASPSVLLIPAHRTVNLMESESGGWARLSWHVPLREFHRTSGIPAILSEHTRSPQRHPYCWGATQVSALDIPAELARTFTAKLIEV